MSEAIKRAASAAATARNFADPSSAANTTPRQWLVPDLIPSGEITLLGGKVGKGNTRLAAQLALGVAAAGRPHSGQCDTDMATTASPQAQASRTCAETSRIKVAGAASSSYLGTKTYLTSQPDSRQR